MSMMDPLDPLFMKRSLTPGLEQLVELDLEPAAAGRQRGAAVRARRRAQRAQRHAAQLRAALHGAAAHRARPPRLHLPL